MHPLRGSHNTSLNTDVEQKRWNNLRQNAEQGVLELVGLEFTRREIVSKIHIGEATLAKRVSEFATTSAGTLTIEEFDTRSREIEAEQTALLEAAAHPIEDNSEPGCHCIHIGKPHVLACYILYCHEALKTGLLRLP